jgi:hypothetical protein
MAIGGKAKWSTRDPSTKQQPQYYGATAFAEIVHVNFIVTI